MAVTKKTAAAAKNAAAKTVKEAVTPAAAAPVKTEEAPKKAPAKKAPVKKAAEKKPAKVFIEFAGRQILAEDAAEKAKAAYVAAGHKEADIKTLEVYVKLEENVAYYVVNGEGSDDFKVALN